MSVSFRLNRPAREIVEKHITPQAKLFMANEVRRLCDPYVPYDTGNLADNVDVLLEGDTGVVHYKAPYARKCYEGDDINFHTEKHALATAHWDKAMFQTRKGDTTKAVQAYIDRGN
ncbi:hypothetical protein AGMMS49975_22610 [Clostridia bacterium]|nr:hypothetical protein AGMMS49975_22610 [Clostridia bacterium]